ncbi:lysozyme inhibitor LprI family protein [Bermanella sp. R86510]|uniref:lysozyme inhibitor LprI family protein n=1 Tax=unclassified Bermanella TaxID=2627862 RepID=UPI0037C89073
MKLSSITLSFFIILIGNYAFSSDIDTELKSCISSNQTTAGMTNCTNKALLEWDSELNSTYQELRLKLSEDARNSLLNAQRSWIEYKDAEIQNINDIYDSLEGTMYIPMRANAILQITKKRTLELKSYLALVSK